MISGMDDTEITPFFKAYRITPWHVKVFIRSNVRASHSPFRNFTYKQSVLDNPKSSKELLLSKPTDSIVDHLTEVVSIIETLTPWYLLVIGLILVVRHTTRAI